MNQKVVLVANSVVLAVLLGAALWGHEPGVAMVLALWFAANVVAIVIDDRHGR